jgi:predicted chitinase
MLTTEQLQAIMPLLPAAKRATLFPFLTAAVNEFGIDQPARTAAFLAQLAHESAQFRFMEEIWGPTASQRRYEPPGKLAGDLGNTDAGDGRRFKGRGPIQITGRANYRRFGDLLGLDLVSAPEQAGSPEVAFRIAGLYWSKKGLNELADRMTAEAFREITRRINGGFNGLAEREQFYETAKAVLNVVGPGVSFGIEEEPDTVEPIFERGLERMRMEAAAARPRKKTAKRKGSKRAAKKTARKKTASRKRTARRVAGKRAATKAVRNGRARKSARKRAAKRR